MKIKPIQNMKRLSLLLITVFMVFIGCDRQIRSDQTANGINDTISRFNPDLPNQPNIVWLVAEDLSPYLPSFGDSTITTPQITRLANEGVRYSNVFSVAGVCAPSRFGLATGMYPSSLGAHNMRTQYVKAHMDSIGLILYEVVTPPEVKMMSEIMRRNGYYCTNNDKTDYQFRPTETAWDESSPYAHWRNRPKDQPFFSVFNFDITHESQIFTPTRKKNLRYVEGFPDPTAKYEGNLDTSEWILHVPEDLKVPVPPYLPETEKVLKDIRRNYSNIKVLDQEIGLILSQLEEDGLLENTIIVFYTDHGGPLPRQKRLMYDSGLKVPMIIRYPGKRGAGLIDDQLISFIDFAPTTFSFAGFQPPDYLQGQAFAGTYQNETPRKYIHAAADRLDTEYDMIRAVRDNRFKYLRNFKPEQGYYLPVKFRENMASMQELLRMRDEGTLNEVQMQWFRENKPEEELFDTWSDPHEINNIADDPKYAAKLAELRAECDRWMKNTDDKGFIPEGELISQFWPNWEQPVTNTPNIQVAGNQVRIECATEGASIGYQIIDADEEPSEHWNVYTEPFIAEDGKKVVVVADRIGFKPSETIQKQIGNN